MDTLLLNSKIKDDIKTAAEILQGGGLVALPTETVYGLGANALDENAVQNIFKAKGRPQDNPLIIHIGRLEDFGKYGVVNPLALKLAEAFWPGPLTLIVEKKPVIPSVVSAGLNSVGVRMPSHPVAMELINTADIPIAAPSANTSGKPSPTRACHVMEDMDGKIDAVLDGGDCQIGVESTVVDTLSGKAAILRPGAVTIDMISSVLGEDKVLRTAKTSVLKNEAPKAPGMKYRHYAPKAIVHLICGSPNESCEYIKSRVQNDDGVLCFSEFLNEFTCKTIDFGKSYDKKAHAHVLFSAFRDFDNECVKRIFVQCPREYGEDIATVNRLKKSSEGNVYSIKSKDIIGIVGRSGSGKTHVSRSLSKNSMLINADELYSQMLTQDCDMTKELSLLCPSALKDGKIQRQLLSLAVFKSPLLLKDINRITHHYIVDEILRKVQTSKQQTIYIDAPTLFESGLHLYCTKLIGVVSSESSCIERIMLRDGITLERAKKRLAQQLSNDFFIEFCDEIIYN